MNIVLLSTLGLHPYRTVDLVEPRLETSVFEDCTSIKEGLHSIRFSIREDGQASLLDGEPCFSSIEGIAFPKSPAKEIFTWDVIIQDGVLFPQLLRKEHKEILFPGIFAQEKASLQEDGDHDEP